LKAEELMRFWPSFGAKSRSDEDLEAAAKFASPVTYITKNMPPTLITHGDKDLLVPIQQSEVVMKHLETLGVPHKLIVKEGAAHGWQGLDKDVAAFGDWIDQHLKK
jgi:dipeptidyl aminopeptidase/acylaminoacyl peptidase